VELKAKEIFYTEEAAVTVAKISAEEGVINLNDDISLLKVLVCKPGKGRVPHKAYIDKSPDGKFNPNTELNRSEAATMLSRALDLQPQKYLENQFADVKADHWAAKDISTVASAGVLKGTGDGNFKPESKITRAEFVVALSRYIGLKNVEAIEQVYNDVKGHWAENNINQLRRLNILEENNIRIFRPDENITRVEAVIILNRLLDRGPLTKTKATFLDIPEGYWAFGDIEEAAKDHDFTRNVLGQEEELRADDQ